MNCFLETMREEDSFSVLLYSYGQKIADEIFSDKSYALYKNRYLGWTSDIEMRWQDYCNKCVDEKDKFEKHSKLSYDNEVMHILKAVVHDVVERSFTQDWSKGRFLETYKKNIDILMKGISSIESKKMGEFHG